ncbi:MAG: DUF3500 domain-containing protein [Planctomycetales bacterium]|nr:DUF3500 domain-containing protein [Planctomycetales bacterium]
MDQQPRTCPDCDRFASDVDRREFLKRAGIGAAALGVGPALLRGEENSAGGKTDPESLVKRLYDTFSDKQKNEICFDWAHVDGERGLLRTRVANNWQITQPKIDSPFYTDEQRDIVRSIFEGLYNPDWLARIDQQLKDDAGGYGKQQSLAVFGRPGEDKFEFVMTGRHMTIRCDGNSADHVAFGGPIFYGHAAQGFNEKPDHPGNVFWPQALAANKLYQMLDGKQQKAALVDGRLPREQDVNFHGTAGGFDGIPVTELSADQKEHLQGVLAKLVEPYRQSDREEALECLKCQGGLDACHLAFYSARDIGGDSTWDNWRLEGPSFVWYFRGSPHVHVWVNVADDPSVKLNA